MLVFGCFGDLFVFADLHVYFVVCSFVGLLAYLFYFEAKGAGGMG